MNNKQFLSTPLEALPEAISTIWSAPSNIALVKYWGKYGEQLPKNTSLSFTLDTCRTLTKVVFDKSVISNKSKFSIYLDGETAPHFEPKVQTFLDRIIDYVSFLKSYNLTITTSNSFPHSSGIASSASGMAALALCIVDLERQLDPTMTDDFFYQKASFLARLGSGSACRSIQGPLVLWGEHQDMPNSSNLVGTIYKDDVHTDFLSFQDTILLVDKGEKQVSSTVGHDLMNGHAFAKGRFDQAQDNIKKLKSILAKGELDDFIKLVESEALTLHAMMMTSHPYFILLKPNTLNIINKIWEYRKETLSKACFTLDAGANVHFLYPKDEKTQIDGFIKNNLAQYCQNGQYIHDQVGWGAKKM